MGFSLSANGDLEKGEADVEAFITDAKALFNKYKGSVESLWLSVQGKEGAAVTVTTDDLTGEASTVPPVVDSTTAAPSAGTSEPVVVSEPVVPPVVTRDTNAPVPPPAGKVLTSNEDGTVTEVEPVAPVAPVAPATPEDTESRFAKLEADVAGISDGLAEILAAVRK